MEKTVLQLLPTAGESGSCRRRGDGHGAWHRDGEGTARCFCRDQSSDPDLET